MPSSPISAQIEIVNRVFAPSDAEVEWARTVVAAYERRRAQNEGVFVVDGAMIDLPIAERARRILAETERSERSEN